MTGEPNFGMEELDRRLRGGDAQALAERYAAARAQNPRVPPDAELIYVGKKGGGLHAFTQEGINKLLVELAKQGKMVVRLKGGDPFIFGRGAEEIEELVSEGIEFEVVPGILNLWTLLLNRSLEDIEEALKSKKKPKSLKKYEIHLRKAIKETQDYKTKTPFDQQDAFNACLVRAETIRKQFVEILFLH